MARALQRGAAGEGSLPLAHPWQAVQHQGLLCALRHALMSLTPCCTQLPALAEALGAEVASSQLLPLYLQLLR